MGQYVVFKSNDQAFAIDVHVVKRVVESDSFIKIPEVADYVMGVYEYENAMIPVIDLRQKLFNIPTEMTPEAKVILCRWQDRLLGAYVADIDGIFELQEANYEDELRKANLKNGYIDKFLKLNEDVVISLELDYLFNNEQAGQLLTLDAEPELTNHG
ncbi:chemotaxis protein CheW [Periweissella fabalis]|uniref:Chemotaxis protein CheW n=1 Tax=Periweissella fabalis TaxID=1070421 RepID=A0A7X6N1F4_9LACO|nr:chemotaxis protein CheW [Periweissella fabalis]MCM0599944.1 chemotaxis protein CheW [Periweissella fabalis]NKZ24001.1 chemotaxis protein CheW [Periweissella fabalis]